MNPLLSIIIATHNGDKYIPKAIESVLAQNFCDWELIIVDDNSKTRNTQKIVEQFQKKDRRIQYYRLENNLGGGEARNFGIKKSNGKYIAILDDDDEWIDTEKTKKQIKFLETHHKYVMVGTNKIKIANESGEEIYKDNKPSEDESIRKDMFLKNNFIISSVMFARDAFDEVGGFKNLRLCEDYDLWLRLGNIGKIKNIDSVVKYTLRSGSVGSRKKIQLSKAMLKAIRRNRSSYQGYFKGLFFCILRIIYYSFFGFRPPSFWKKKIVA